MNNSQIDIKKGIIETKHDLHVDLNGLTLKNPVTVASGTFGNGKEYCEFIDLNNLGAISVKGITLDERLGNDGCRMIETRQGMINSVGLQNQGVEKFIKDELPWLKQFDLKVIANINGNTIEEYCELAKILSKTEVDSLELNISCPNVKNGGLAFGTNPQVVREIVRSVRSITDKHLMVKLSPNVTNISEIAKIVEEEKANCISMINTFAGMAINIHSRSPEIKRQYGGYSGPAIKPIAIKMVHDVYNTVDIPILGMGGVSNYKDAIEFMIAGASAIAVGTENFRNPLVTEEILKGIDEYLLYHQELSIKSLIGNIKKS